MAFIAGLMVLILVLHLGILELIFCLMVVYELVVWQSLASVLYRIAVPLSN